MSPGFVSHIKGMVQPWLDEAKATKREKDATTPKSRAVTGRGGGAGGGGGGGGERRAADGGTGVGAGAGGGLWSPSPMMRQVRRGGCSYVMVAVF